MEIIKNNCEHIEKPRTIQCEHCGSILKVDSSDIYDGKMEFTNEINRPEIGYFKELVTCPCCNKPTRLVPVH